ncbi:hypothetical protein D9756_011395 [Leucocoprinus leucothites]|uniref:Uncharacterized protein n=1 Tax=Leucocoprinus leucothites TaxID=201217 RepID=A0A8H5FRR9_9AGAR|nr:hypothetical protein D9756_011395 [Leucoagaricus leucothites]
MASPAYGGQSGSSANSRPASLTGNASSMPIPVLSYNTPEERHGGGGDLSHSSGERLDASPPATPHQALLGSSDGGGVQFASYRSEKRGNEDYAEGREGGSVDPKWLPLPLRLWFWLPLVVVLVLGAIGLEIALHFSKKNQGWKSSGDIGSTENALHYVYTLPPVIVMAVPYVDLVHGDSPPHRSLLLDYTRYNNFFVWSRAAANRHYLVALASLMVLLSMSFQPLAAALLAVRDTWLAQPGKSIQFHAIYKFRANRLLGVNIFNQRAIGLNQNNQFNDLTSFLTASGYAGASILYDLGDPPFIHQGYTVGLFDLPTFITSNGSVIANTTAVKSVPNCVPVSVNMNQTTTGWDNSVSSGNCSITWSVDQNARTLFGTNTTVCNPEVPQQFLPVVFWFFTYETTPPQSSATLCSPTIELWDVEATADVSTGNLTNIRELRPFSSASNFSSLAANVTGAPLEGRAYNGIQFNLTDPDEFVTRRGEALQLQLPAAVFQAAVASPEGVIGSFDANKFVNLVTRVYTTYLALVASTVYFLPHQEPLVVEVRSFQKRVWLSDVAVHLLTTAMLLLALFATLIQLFHRHDRRQLRLKHEPGTIASAVSIGAQTGMGDLLAGRQRAEEMDNILRGKRFRIEPRTMKIIMEGEEGYEVAASPMDRRRSVFAALQNARLGSRRFSTQPPGTPKSPASPGRQQGV